MSIRNKWFLVLAGLATATLVFAAACGGDDDEDDGGGDETPAATSDAGSGDKAPADQQKIVVAMPEPQFLDPQKSNFEQDIAVLRTLFRGLYNLRDDGEGGVEVVDGLADGEPQVRILDGAAGVHGASLVPFGTSGDPGSAHYFDQAKLLSERRLKPEWFTEQEVMRHAVRTYHPGDKTE